MAVYVVEHENGQRERFSSNAEYRFVVVEGAVDQSGYVAWKVVRKSKSWQAAKNAMYSFNVNYRASGYEYQVRRVVAE